MLMGLQVVSLVRCHEITSDLLHCYGQYIGNKLC